MSPVTLAFQLSLSTTLPFALQTWKMWDMGGKPKFRKMWDGFLARTDAVIMVIDCT